MAEARKKRALPKEGERVFRQGWQKAAAPVKQGRWVDSAVSQHTLLNHL